MADRNRQPLQWGAGLDRATGTMADDPATFNDLRNVQLNKGSTEMRKGLLRALLIPAPWTDLLGVYLIRAQGLAGAVVYDSVARKVGLFAIDASGVASAFVDYLWDIPAGATVPPRVSATDQYDQLVIAHDEPIYPVRQATMVYNAIESTIGPLMLDMGRTGSPEGAKFRGVAKHLAYILGWGYGTNQPGQGDRGEVLRISLPGEPTNFVPEHYFLVGTQGDPIVGGGALGKVFAVQKIASSFVLNGADRLTFNVDRLDPKYGLAGARLGVPVNAEWFFWSLSGPRSTAGGASSDLGLPLDIPGPVPDPLASATNTEDGFAYYDETEREVVFCFGRWAYVLHLKDGDRRWSYRQFAVALVNAGSLYVGGSIALGSIVAHPEIASVVYVEPTYAPGDGNPKFTVNWTNVGGALTTETLEVWIRSQVAGSPWRRKAAVAAAGGTTTFTIDGHWTTYDIALRYVLGGFAAAGYASANPAMWPAISRGTQTSGGEVTAWTLGKWKRLTGTSQGYDVLTFTGPGLNATSVTQPLSYRIERDFNDTFGYSLLVTGVSYAALATAVRFLNTDALKHTNLRIRPEGAHGNGAWFILGTFKDIGPEGPATVTVAAPPVRTPNNSGDNHDLSWTAPAAVGTDTPSDGPYEWRARHTSAPSPPGAYGTLESGIVGTHARSLYPTPLIDPSSGGVRTAEAQVRVNISGDVSPWIQSTVFEP